MSCLSPATPNTADAQSPNPNSTALLHRTVIEEGQTRYFQISELPDHPEYYFYLKPLSGYTAEASDFTFTVDRSSLQGHDKELAPGAGSQAFPEYTVDWSQNRLTFEVEAHKDSPTDTDDETFGVQLCTTANCTGGTILGDWTVTIKDADDTVLTGTGATITVSGGHTTMMEFSPHLDTRDNLDDITIRLAAVPTEDIVVLGKVDTQVAVKQTPLVEKAIARLSGPPASGNSSNNPGDWYVVGHFTNMIAGVDTSADPARSHPAPGNGGRYGSECEPRRADERPGHI